MGALLYGGVKAGRLRKVLKRYKFSAKGKFGVWGASMGCWRCVFCAFSAVSAVRWRPRPFTFDGLVGLHKNALDVRQWAWKKFSVYISSVLMKLSFVHSFASNLLLWPTHKLMLFLPVEVTSTTCLQGEESTGQPVRLHSGLEARAVDCRDTFLFVPRREETAWL